MNILGYYEDKSGELGEAESVFVAIEKTRNGRVQVYAPIGQHSEADEGYIKECRKITKEHYIKASKGFYTPFEYIQ